MYLPWITQAPQDTWNVSQGTDLDPQGTPKEPQGPPRARQGIPRDSLWSTAGGPFWSFLKTYHSWKIVPSFLGSFSQLLQLLEDFERPPKNWGASKSAVWQGDMNIYSFSRFGSLFGKSNFSKSQVNKKSGILAPKGRPTRLMSLPDREINVFFNMFQFLIGSWNFKKLEEIVIEGPSWTLPGHHRESLFLLDSQCFPLF